MSGTIALYVHAENRTIPRQRLPRRTSDFFYMDINFEAAWLLEGFKNLICFYSVNNMNEHIEEEKKLSDIEKRLRTIEVSLYFVFSAIFLFVLLIDINSQLQIPYFKRIFVELLEGESLPGLTEFVLHSYKLFFITDLVFLAIILLLLGLKKTTYLLPTCTVFTIILLIKTSITVTSMFLPLLHILQKLGG